MEKCAQTLLDDAHPTVRSTAILGVCKILGQCWELLPAPIITDFLKKLVMELTTDCSSPDVRCSVFKVDDPVGFRSGLDGAMILTACGVCVCV